MSPASQPPDRPVARFSSATTGRATTHKAGYSADYRRDYGAIAHMLGSGRLQPSEAETAFVDDLATNRYAVPGSISPADVTFLSAIIGASGSRRGVEIGTASGLSTAVIAAALARNFTERGETPSATLLDTIDRKARCLFDESKPTGYVVRETFPALAPHVRFHTGEDARIARRFLGRRELDFAFIDGNHQHPWPLMDALCLLPLLRPGAWIVMHDIDNPPDRPAAEVRLGARHVFQAWPWAKLDGGYIGAVQTSATGRGVTRFVAGLLREPFEVTEPAHARYRKRIKKLVRDLRIPLRIKLLDLCGF